MAAVAVLVATMGVGPAAHAQTSVHPVTGRLLDGSGRPLGRHAVILAENRGVANDVFGAFAAVFSLGLTCLAGADPCRSSGSSRVDTNADGQFSFSVAQVTAAMGHSDGVILAAGIRDVEGSLAVRLNPSIGGDLGELQLWEPQVRQATVDRTLQVRWTAPPTANGSTVLAGAVSEGTSNRTFVSFHNNGVRGAVDLDPRQWEDRPAAATFTVGFHRARANQNPRIDWLSKPYPMPRVGAPLSRGASCRFPGYAAVQTCPLTDGDLFTVAAIPCASTSGSPTTAACPPVPPTAVIDLGRSVSAGLVAVRPAVQNVSVSGDGVTWRSLLPTRPAGLWAAGVFAADGPAWRYLQVAQASTGSGVAEVSVWPGGQPAAVAPSPPTSSSSSASPLPGAVTHTGGSHHPPIGLVILAVLCLIGVGAALGIALDRHIRRRRRDGRVRLVN